MATAPLPKSLIVVDFKQMKIMQLGITQYVLLRVFHANADINGICIASLEDVGVLMGMDKITVWRQKNKLEEKGWLLSMNHDYNSARNLTVKLTDAARKIL